jgi:hypothetical protein
MPYFIGVLKSRREIYGYGGRLISSPAGPGATRFRMSARALGAIMLADAGGIQADTGGELILGIASPLFYGL